jgi:hypothetical protein
MNGSKLVVETKDDEKGEMKMTKNVIVNADALEHLLNCMDNQKFIHEQSKDTQKEWQEIIDKANREMRRTLIEQTKR